MHRIVGAITAYLLAGVFFGRVFFFLELLSPGSFHGAEGAVITSGELAYFSFVTLTTVGYGDFTAALPAARSLAVLEGLIGQLYPAILIARLVTMELMSHKKNR